MFEKGLDSCGVLGGRVVQTSICEPGFVVGAVPAVDVVHCGPGRCFARNVLSIQN